MRILVTGSNGQLGRELQKVLPEIGEVFPLDRFSCNLESELSIRSAVERVKPNVIVNAGAYTNVDAAESDADRAFAINGDAPRILAHAAADIGALLIHYSTDYVFDGEQPGRYTEETAPNPLSIYGRSKLAGEAGVAQSSADYLILRTSWVFGPRGSNFLKTILSVAREREQLSVVADQIGAPTPTSLIANVTVTGILRFVEDKQSAPLGLFHLASAGETSWYEYACYILDAAERARHPLRVRSTSVVAVPSTDYPRPARRPKNSRMDTTKIKAAFNLELPDWKAAVDQVLQEIL